MFDPKFSTDESTYLRTNECCYFDAMMVVYKYMKVEDQWSVF